MVGMSEPTIDGRSIIIVLEPRTNSLSQASEADIERAFQSGDNDDDNTLSVSEASDALQELSGKSIDASTVEAACSSCGVDTSREMTRKLIRDL
jgi:Ca2+-binding EF-hand superfamily protein